MPTGLKEASVARPRRRVTEDVLAVLRDQAEQLPIGAKMPTESQIVTEHGVSRQTAREVFAILRSEGYVDIQHGKGAFIVDKSANDVARFQGWFRGNQFEIAELLEMRAAVEPYVAELAASRMTEDDLECLRRSAEDFESVLRGGDVEAKVAADEEFHSLIMKASGNKGLTTFYETFIPSLREYRKRVFSPPADPLLALPHHQRIYTSIRDRDPQRAHDQMREHIEHSRLDVHRLASKDRRSDGAGG